jgi:hypothetical protein
MNRGGRWIRTLRQQRKRVAACLVATAGLAPSPSRAADSQQADPWAPGRRTTRLRPSVRPAGDAPGADGVYGRFEGDLDLGLGAGVALEQNGTWAAAWGSMHYFSTVGAYVSYRDALDNAAVVTRSLAAGIDLRPAFVPRWAENLEQGPGWLDLTIDSWSLGLGAFWDSTAGGAFGERRGLEAALGLGLPVFASAQGPWLRARGTLRWPEHSGASTGRAVPSLLLLFCWHALLTTPLVGNPRDG